MSSRKVVVLAAAAAVVAALFVPVRAQLEADRRVLPADGRASARIRGYHQSISGRVTSTERPSIDAAAAHNLGVTILPAHDGSLVVRAGHSAGSLSVTIPGAAPVDLQFTLDPRDADGDGLPDAAELITREDRGAFIAWFTAIAEAQATKLDDSWATVHQDCAGLVRFAFREALKRHDRAWLAERRFLPAFHAPDVASMTYPALPFVGDRPFRANSDPFDPSMIDQQFTAAPGARALWQQNSVLISRELADARPGDLLFFAVPYDTGSRMHTMLVLGSRPGATGEDLAARVVYHTGYDEDSHDGKKGEVKLVRFEDLLAHPDASWHPVAHNLRFLGVHRLIHLVHETRRFNDG